MRKIILGIALLAFFGCSENNEAVKENVSNYRLKKITRDSETVEFFYNKNQLSYILTKELNGDDYKSLFIYENGRVIQIKNYTNNVYQSNEDNYFVYLNNDIKTSSGYEDGILFSHQYEYNDLKQMIVDSQYNDGIYDSKNTYTYYSNGNIKSNVHSDFDSGGFNYDYDDKINPYYYTYPSELCKIWVISKNNVLNGRTKFEYDSNNLPIKRTEKYTESYEEVEYFEYY